MSMVAQDFMAFNRALRDNGIIFSFSGYVSEKVLASLGDVLRQRMTQNDTEANVSRRVFSVFIEQAQNVIRYSVDRIESVNELSFMSAGMITVGIDSGRFFVVCGNEIDKTLVPRLRERLEQIASMTSDELKTYYRTKLREPPEEGSLGGSIGLIEIARRASEPVQFDFQDVDNERAFFCLKAFI